MVVSTFLLLNLIQSSLFAFLHLIAVVFASLGSKTLSGLFLVVADNKGYYYNSITLDI